MNGLKEPEPWYMSDPKVYVSRPLKSFFIGDWGFYILKHYKYRFFPKFYFFKNKYFIEIGVSLAGFLFEIQNNKIEKVSKS